LHAYAQMDRSLKKVSLFARKRAPFRPWRHSFVRVEVNEVIPGWNKRIAIFYFLLKGCWKHYLNYDHHL
jgi:type IV secretory pathway TrbF-like protein